MKKLNKVRWGIIGVGDVTEKKSGPAFYKIDNSELVAVMRRDEKKAADYARRHNVSKWYADATDLINDPEVDAVYIATPPDSHANYAAEVMRAGKPVYVEKPMARNYCECQEMIKVSEETGKPIWVAYYRRSLPAFLKVKELVNTGAIGNPLVVNIKLYKQASEKDLKKEDMPWRVIPEIAGAGHLFDLASHQFDYLDFVFGPVKNVCGKALNKGGFYPSEDTVTGSWEHESGVLGTGSWSFLVSESEETDEIEIIGDKGRIQMSCFSHGKVKVVTPGGVAEMGFNNPDNISQCLVQQVVAELRGEGNCVSTGISAARTSWVLDEMVKNYYSGK